jgi:hypothetical protein
MIERMPSRLGTPRRARAERLREAALTTPREYVRPAKVLLLFARLLLLALERLEPPPGMRSVAPSITMFEDGILLALASRLSETP